MITGYVNSQLLPIVEVEVEDQSGKLYPTEAIIDTAFSGDLTLPPMVIARLGLVFQRQELVTLGDGTTQLFDEYVAIAFWDMNLRAIKVWKSDNHPWSGRIFSRVTSSPWRCFPVVW